ncbi:MAG: YdcF family protein [Caldilineales bacterium]|nr:YdcF family protein [Caldilineales bacterium]
MTSLSNPRLGSSPRRTQSRSASHRRNPLRWFGLALALIVGLTAAVLLFAYLDVTLRYRGLILQPAEVSKRPAAIVFGAGIYPSGRLSAVLADRMNTAIGLYQNGAVEKLLLTGDNSLVEYNEPGRMGDYARQVGLPEAALAYDYAGRRTYDSCYRARHIFGLDRVVLVTQRFHLPRALYICRQLGVDAVGVAADERNYRLAGWFALRESFARVAAWADIHFLHPEVIGGEPIDIFAPGYVGRVE